MKLQISRLVILVAICILSVSCTVDYWYYRLVLENDSGHNVSVEWSTNTSLEEAFVLSNGSMVRSELKKYPAPCVDWATITFEDGKVLRYTSEDKGRTMCNSDYYDIDEVATSVIYIKYTLTEEDYALAVMPSEE